MKSCFMCLLSSELIALHAGAISFLIVADWPLHYIVENFNRFLPEISMTQGASFRPRMDARAFVQGFLFNPRGKKSGSLCL